MPRINPTIESIPFYLTKKISEETGAEPGSINLSRGQAGFKPPKRVFELATETFDSSDRSLFKYEKIAGSPKLRESIANWYKRLYDLDIDPARILVTDGGTGGIHVALKTTTEYGGKVMIPDPAYPYYVLSTEFGLEGRTTIRPAIGNGPLTAADIEKAYEPGLTAVVLTSPHNPSGAVYTAEGLTEIMELAYEKDFFVIYDENHFPEIFDDYCHVPITAHDPKKSHSIMLGSLSRLGLQGLRIGWAILPENLTTAFSQCYSTQNLSVNTPCQRLATKVLDEYETLGLEKEFAVYQEKRDWFVPRINTWPGFSCHMPEGTCYAFPNIEQFVADNREKMESVVREQSEKRGRDDLDFVLAHPSMLAYKFLLYEAGVGGLPGLVYGPETDGYMRLSFSVPFDEVKEAVERIERVLSTL